MRGIFRLFVCAAVMLCGGLLAIRLLYKRIVARIHGDCQLLH